MGIDIIDIVSKNGLASDLKRRMVVAIHKKNFSSALHCLERVVDTTWPFHPGSKLNAGPLISFLFYLAMDKSFFAIVLQRLAFSMGSHWVSQIRRTFFPPLEAESTLPQPAWADIYVAVHVV